MKGRPGERQDTTDASLIGRRHQLSTLWDHFRLTTEGSTAAVPVSGEPGIGKTRLLDQFASEISRAGAAVLRGSATEAGGMPPYFPFVTALGRYVRATDSDKLREQIGQWAGILSTIIPELAALTEEFPARYPLPQEQARYRLYEAVGECLAAIALERPLVVILDDIQWADTASLDLLSYVTSREPQTRLFILGAYRKGEAVQHSALERTLTELNRQRVLTTIALGPFSDQETAALVSTRLGGDVSVVASRLVYARSEGNPFFAEELLREWLETGVLKKSAGGWSVSQAPTATIPTTIASAIRRRLDRLPAETVDVLRTAAILGRTFETGLLALATGQEEETVEDKLLDAQQAEMIRYTRDGTYTFVHDQIRECLYAQVTPIRRRRLHGFIGRAIELSQEGGNARRSAELAFHFARSGDRGRGVMYARLAAQGAMETYAFEEALAYYRTAVDLLASDDPERAGLLLAFGEAATLAGSESAAATAFEEARQWFLDAGDLEAAARSSHGLGQALWRQDGLAHAEAAFEGCCGAATTYRERLGGSGAR